METPSLQTAERMRTIVIIFACKNYPSDAYNIMFCACFFQRTKGASITLLRVIKSETVGDTLHLRIIIYGMTWWEVHCIPNIPAYEYYSRIRFVKTWSCTILCTINPHLSLSLSLSLSPPFPLLLSPSILKAKLKHTA
jgi:hypothetical protein